DENQANDPRVLPQRLIEEDALHPKAVSDENDLLGSLRHEVVDPARHIVRLLVPARPAASAQADAGKGLRACTAHEDRPWEILRAHKMSAGVATDKGVAALGEGMPQLDEQRRVERCGRTMDGDDTDGSGRTFRRSYQQSSLCALVFAGRPHDLLAVSLHT